jgi:hypothetical protein
MMGQTMQRPCPNEDMGAADVAPGQVWHHYQDHSDMQGYYRLAEIDSHFDVELELIYERPHGGNAESLRRTSMGNLLACWQFVP